MQKDYLYRQLLESLYDGVYYVDLNRNISYWNKAAEKITGYTHEEVVGKTCYDNVLRHINVQGIELCNNGCPLHATLRDGQFRETELIFLHHKEGYRVPVYVRVAPIYDDKNENIVGAVEIFNENSAKLEVEKKIKELEAKVNMDPLTRIPNRGFIESLLDENLYMFQKFGNPFGVLFIDIDNFKKINDTFGHKIGDQVLKMVATTLVRNIRPDDMVCRWGGEEFVAFFKDISLEELRAVANKLLLLVRHSFLIEDEIKIQTTVSIGGSIVKNTDDLAGLINRADENMYYCKKHGKNRVLIKE